MDNPVRAAAWMAMVLRGIELGVNSIRLTLPLGWEPSMRPPTLQVRFTGCQPPSRDLTPDDRDRVRLLTIRETPPVPYRDGLTSESCNDYTPNSGLDP